MQRPILQRLFGAGVMDSLGVRMDSVPVGRAEWPLITGGVAPAQTKEPDAAAAAVTAAFSFANLKPKRLSGRYEYTHEEAASVPDIEGALRRDLADAVKSAMSNAVINGAAPTNAAPQNVQGFISKIGAATDLSTAEATAADYGRLHALAVDGIHASMETEVTGVIGDETYQHAAGVYIAGSGESGSELLRRRSGGCMASTYLPDAASMKQSAILHAAGPNGGGTLRGDSVAALWPDAGSDPRYLLASEPRRSVNVGFVVGCERCVPIRRLQAHRGTDFELIPDAERNRYRDTAIAGGAARRRWPGLRYAVVRHCSEHVRHKNRLPAAIPNATRPRISGGVPTPARRDIPACACGSASGDLVMGGVRFEACVVTEEVSSIDHV